MILTHLALHSFFDGATENVITTFGSPYSKIQSKPWPLRKGQAGKLMVLLIDEDDFETGLLNGNLTVQASKDGGVFTTITPIVVERSHGWYSLEIDAADLDTYGELVLHVTAPGALSTEVVCQVVGYEPSSWLLSVPTFLALK